MIRLATTLAMTLAASSLSACVRWQPETSSPIKLTRACPFRIAPKFGGPDEAPVRAVYNFVVQNASRDELASFLQGAHAAGLGVWPLTISINGKDTRFAQSSVVLRTQTDVDAEFARSCGLGSAHIYLTHVQYNKLNEINDEVRIR